MFSDYDKTHLNEIINLGHGDWTETLVLRFLDKFMVKADMNNLIKVYSIWPEEVEAIYKFWGWEEGSVFKQISLIQYQSILNAGLQNNTSA